MEQNKFTRDNQQRDRGQEVLERLEHVTTLPHLPEEYSEEMRRFLKYTAENGLWDLLEKEDSRITQALILYYFDEHTQREVGQKIGLSGKTINGFLDRGVEFLWKGLPENLFKTFDTQEELFDKKMLSESRHVKRDAWKHDSGRKSEMVQKLVGRKHTEVAKRTMSQTRRARADEWREYGRRGGIASGKIRRKNNYKYIP